MEQCRVLFGIEANAQRITDAMNGYFEIVGINWHDGHLPQITKARKLNELQGGEESFAELITRIGKSL